MTFNLTQIWILGIGGVEIGFTLGFGVAAIIFSRKQRVV